MAQKARGEFNAWLMKIIRDLFLIIIFIGLLQNFMQRDMRSGAVADLAFKTISGEDSAKLLANKPAIIYFVEVGALFVQLFKAQSARCCMIIPE